MDALRLIGATTVVGIFFVLIPHIVISWINEISPITVYIMTVLVETMIVFFVAVVEEHF